MKYYWGNGKEDEIKRTQEIFIKEPSILEVVRNRIYFYSDINSANIMELNQEIRDMSNRHIAETQNLETEFIVPIWLHIRSFGGSIFDGLAGMDSILQSKTPIHTIVDGCCASAATFLSIVGEKRLMNKHSFILIHQLSSMAWGKYEEIKDEMKNCDLLMDTIRSVYKEHTKIPVEKLDEILKHDLWFDANTCLEYGLIDEIL
jgi:ATP-dependent Clp endopeptidase proteolytic subunit ClpP